MAGVHATCIACSGCWARVFDVPRPPIPIASSFAGQNGALTFSEMSCNIELPNRVFLHTPRRPGFLWDLHVVSLVGRCVAVRAVQSISAETSGVLFWD